MQTIFNPEIQRDELICPITLRVFRDPVIAKDGHAYERTAISRWILEHGTSPLTREPLQIEDLIPAIHLKNLAARRQSSIVSYNVSDNTIIGLPSIELTHNNDQTNRPQTARRSKRTFIVVVTSILGFAALIGFLMIVKSTQSKVLGSAATRPDGFYSTYYSSLSTFDIPTFIPPGATFTLQQYQVIQLFIPINGFYTFNITSYTYGLIYLNEFNSSIPYTNLIASNKDGSNNRQFNIGVYLVTYSTYFLVVTTYGGFFIGSFSVNAYGPGKLTFVNIAMTMTTTITSSTTPFNTF